MEAFQQLYIILCVESSSNQSLKCNQVKENETNCSSFQVPDEATYDVDDITWSYETGEGGVTLDHAAILAMEEGYSIVVNNKTTTLIIAEAGQDNAVSS